MAVQSASGLPLPAIDDPRMVTPVRSLLTGPFNEAGAGRPAVAVGSRREASKVDAE